MVREDNLKEYVALPENRPSKLSSTFLSGLWKISILKSGLGAKNKDAVHEWFLRHPEMGLEFDRLNLEFEMKVFDLQQRGVNLLREKCIEEFNFHKLTIEDESMEEDMDVNYKPDDSWRIKKEKK